MDLPGGLDYYALKDVIIRRKIFLTVFVVFLIACFIMVWPQILYTSLSSLKMVPYTGTGLSDIHVEIQQVEDLEGKTASFYRDLGEDPEVEKLSMLVSRQLTVQDGEGIRIFRTYFGDHGLFPVNYLGGRGRLEGRGRSACRPLWRRSWARAWGMSFSSWRTEENGFWR